jgi:3-methyladenine DNA glycosylase AlkD
MKSPRARRPAPTDVDAIVATLKRKATKKTRDGMARYGLPSDHALGVPIGTIKALGKQIGKDHDLAAALWKTGVYEARILAAFVGEADRVTAVEMDRWCRDFDNWGICDTVCFVLWDRTPLAWRKIGPWARRREEFVKRTAFVLLACLALHDKKAEDAAFLKHLPLVERGASDERNFVKKGVSWALRAVGRRNAALNTPCVALARRLRESPDPAARWVGADALRDLTRTRATRA